MYKTKRYSSSKDDAGGIEKDELLEKQNTHSGESFS